MLIENAQKLNIHLNQVQVEQFDLYLRLILEYNAKFNLTAITNPDEIMTKHFLDCIAAASHMPPNSIVADVGSGAGFPGMVIKIARPDVSITLMDALNKRVDFLRTVAKDLNLDNIDCVHIRAEDAGKEPIYREQFDVSTSRAVAGMNVLSEYSLPLVKQDGFMLAMKSLNAPSEVEQALPLIESLGGGAVEYIRYTIPTTDIEYALVKITKKSPTPKNFPRRAKKVGVL